MQTLRLLQPPTLNEMINKARSNKYVAAKDKKVWTLRAKKAALEQLTPFADDAVIWIVADFNYLTTASDSDNMVACIKYILDGIVTAGIMPTDSMKHTGNLAIATFTKIPRKEKKYATINLFDSKTEFQTFAVNQIKGL